MEALWKILTWRGNKQFWTFTNGMAIAIFMTGVALLVDSPLSNTTARYFALFWEGRVLPEYLAVGMLCSGAVLLMRRWHAHEVFVLYLPLFAYTFVVVWVTFEQPSPMRPWLRLWFWCIPRLLPLFYFLEKFAHAGTTPDRP